MSKQTKTVIFYECMVYLTLFSICIYVIFTKSSRSLKLIVKIMKLGMNLVLNSLHTPEIFHIDFFNGGNFQFLKLNISKTLNFI